MEVNCHVFSVFHSLRCFALHCIQEDSLLNESHDDVSVWKRRNRRRLVLQRTHSRPSLPGLQLQRPLLANDGKRVREVLLHVLLHLRSTNDRTNVFHLPIKHSESEEGRRCRGIVGDVRTSMPAMSIRSLTLNFCPISRSLGTQYSTMLLNWITDRKTSTVGVKPKPQLGLLLLL